VNAMAITTAIDALAAIDANSQKPSRVSVTA
jgi:hypothetical protein